MALNGPLQVTRSELRVSPFLEQEIPGAPAALEHKIPAHSRGDDPLLHAAQFDIQDFLQIFALQRAEDNYLVHAVHELGRELAPRRVHCRPVDLLVEFLIVVRRGGGITETASHELAYFLRTQVGGQKNQTVREIYAAVVTQSHVPLSRMPSSSCHNASEAFSISSKSTSEI